MWHRTLPDGSPCRAWGSGRSSPRSSGALKALAPRAAGRSRRRPRTGARGGGSSRRRSCAPSVIAGGSTCASTGVQR
eukprot:911059-Prymnesium_polylepis.1